MCQLSLSEVIFHIKKEILRVTVILPFFVVKCRLVVVVDFYSIELVFGVLPVIGFHQVDGTDEGFEGSEFVTKIVVGDEFGDEMALWELIDMLGKRFVIEFDFSYFLFDHSIEFLLRGILFNDPTIVILWPVVIVIHSSDYVAILQKVLDIDFILTIIYHPTTYNVD